MRIRTVDVRVHALFPGWTAGSGACAMVGMTAFFAATAKAPTASIVILFQMTDDYRIMLPLMPATVGSVYISHCFSPFSICTLRLGTSRGIPFPYTNEGERPAAKPAARPSPEIAGM